MSIITFKFKVANKSKHKNNTSIKKSKYINCICFYEDNKFTAHIQINEDNNSEYKSLVLPFTENSYSLKGKTKIFTKIPDKDGKIITIIRDKTLSKLHPGVNDIYTPLRDKFVYGGYIVEINKKHYFDIEDCFTHMNVFYKDDKR